MIRPWRILSSVAVILSSLPRALHACAVCFGGGDSPWAEGFYWGIVILLSLPFVMVAAFAAVIYCSVKKNKTKTIHS